MTTIHDQAMNYVYQQVLQRLQSFFSRAERTALQLLIQRLLVAAGGMEHIGNFKVMVIQSGSRDSCYTLALLRAAQLSLAGRAPATFQLRVATLRLSGTSHSALHNMHRSFGALFLYDDPRVELVMVDHHQVLPFAHDGVPSEDNLEANRMNLLMMGHRRIANERLEFWDDAYLATAEFYSQIARWNNGVDAMIGAESSSRQKLFLERLNRAALKAGIGGLLPSHGGFEVLFPTLDRLGSNYYRQFHTDGEDMPWRPEGQFEACRRSSFIDISDMIVGKLDERWPLLSDFLGFQTDGLTLYHGDHEFAEPRVAAHLRGLQASIIEGRTYEAGVAEFLQDSLKTMRSNHVPEPACEQWLATFGNLLDLEQRRLHAVNHMQEVFGLNETQLTCLLFAPFIEQGAGLERFLRECHPGMLVALPDLHRAMQGLHAPEQVTKWMTDVSGLPVKLIARLYAMAPVQLPESLDFDPRDAQVEGVQSNSGERSAEG